MVSITLTLITVERFHNWRKRIEAFGTKTSLCGGHQKFLILTVSFFFLFPFFLIGKYPEKSTIKEFLATRRNVTLFFPVFEENTLWNVPLYATYSIGTNFCVTEERKLSSVYVASPARENRFERFKNFLMLPSFQVSLRLVVPINSHIVHPSYIEIISTSFADKNPPKTTSTNNELKSLLVKVGFH